MLNLRRRCCAIFIFCILITSILTACQTEQKVSRNDEEALKEIVVASSTDVEIDKLDAISSKGLMQAYPLIYDSLVEYGEKGEIVPKLAETWDISADGRTYTFYLRKGVKFSDGTPFNSEAVKFSVQRWANKPEYSWLNVAKNIEDVEIIDDYTIKMTFNSRYYLTLTEFTYPRPFRIISPSAVEPVGDPNGKFIKAIGTGPWKVEKYIKNDKTIFTINHYYWGEKPKIDRLIIKVIPDPQTRVFALQNEEIDIAGGQMGSIPIESLDIIQKSNRLKVLSNPGTTSYLLMFNNDNELFKDVRVRKAINYAIDKENIAVNLFNNIGSKAQGLFQPTVPYVTKQNNKGYEFNPQKAIELLKQSGWEDSDGDNVLDKDGKPFKISLVLQVEEFPEWKSICEVIQSDLAKIGIDVDLKLLESAAYYDSIWKKRDYDLVIYRTYSDGWNPYSFLISLFYSDDGNSAVAYGDEKLNKLIDQVLTVSNEKDRQQVYDKIFKFMYDEAVCVPIYYCDEIFVINNNISGFEFGSTTYLPVIWNNLDLK
ncbi:nickel ABC transporter substrate-binding protein [Tepidanaerobacter acetatoxydans]|uniref:nickel ABC transporter substrate-binding protein n=1 Tax=Tepidanaerobacter acetatoxydans TaxID=499229 RepID=UPI001BD29269|nr:nickel ABC transporter substrate-binding protein [Tepidanaerobacter acetatoxydans]